MQTRNKQPTHRGLVVHCFWFPSVIFLVISIQSTQMQQGSSSCNLKGPMLHSCLVNDDWHHGWHSKFELNLTMAIWGQVIIFVTYKFTSKISHKTINIIYLINGEGKLPKKTFQLENLCAFSVKFDFDFFCCLSGSFKRNRSVSFLEYAGELCIIILRRKKAKETLTNPHTYTKFLRVHAYPCYENSDLDLDLT